MDTARTYRVVAGFLSATLCYQNYHHSREDFFVPFAALTSDPIVALSSLTANHSSLSLGEIMSSHDSDGQAPRPNPYMAFVKKSAARQQARRPFTRNLTNEVNPYNPVPGQDTYPTSSVLPRDRGLGFDSFNRMDLPARQPEPEPESAAASHSRRGGDEVYVWDSDDLPSDLRPGSDSDEVPVPSKKRKRSRKSYKGKGKAGADSTNSPSDSESEAEHYKPKRVQMTPLPATLEDATLGDRMLWFWKLEGKSWAAIRKEYERITTKTYQESTLSVRFHLMKRSFANNGALELPDEYYQRNPEERYLKDISNRAKQYVEYCEVMMEADKEIAPKRYEAAARIFESRGKKMTPAAIKRKFANMRAMGMDAHPSERRRLMAEEPPNQGGMADLVPEDVATTIKEAVDREVTEEEVAAAGVMVEVAGLVQYPDSD